jgi:hypothetical protein
MANKKVSAALQNLSAIMSGRFAVDAGQVRRGALFLVNIGMPLLVGATRGESQAALAAVVVGMLFGFADNDDRCRADCGFWFWMPAASPPAVSSAICRVATPLCFGRSSSSSPWLSAWRRKLDGSCCSPGGIRRWHSSLLPPYRHSALSKSGISSGGAGHGRIAHG